MYRGWDDVEAYDPIGRKVDGTLEKAGIRCLAPVQLGGSTRQVQMGPEDRGCLAVRSRDGEMGIN